MTARLLWDARLAGRTIAAAELAAIADEPAAYRVQDDLVALARGAPLGWKIGATSAQTQAALGCAGPFYGPLLPGFCHGDGAEIAGAAPFAPGAEAEFALVLGHDLPPRGTPYGEDEVAGAVAAVCPAIEIAGTRLAGGIPGSNPHHLIADGGANVAFVRGAPREDWRAFDLAAQAVRLAVGGVEKASGTGALVLGHPLTALTWLANALRARGQGLRKDEIVTTGTCTGFTPVKAGDVVAADFGGLGTVRTTIV